MLTMLFSVLSRQLFCLMLSTMPMLISSKSIILTSGLAVQVAVVHILVANFLLNNPSHSMLLLLMFCDRFVFFDSVVVLLPVVVPFSCCQVVVLQVVDFHIIFENFAGKTLLIVVVVAVGSSTACSFCCCLVVASLVATRGFCCCCCGGCCGCGWVSVRRVVAVVAMGCRADPSDCPVAGAGEAATATAAVAAAAPAPVPVADPGAALVCSNCVLHANDGDDDGRGNEMQEWQSKLLCGPLLVVVVVVLKWL